jgi:hypothetical protein
MAVLPPVLRPPESFLLAPWSWVGSVLVASAGLLLTGLAGCDWAGALPVTVMTTTDGWGVSPATEGVGVMRMVCTTVAEGGIDEAVTTTIEDAGGGELAGGGADEDAGGGGGELEAGGGLEEAGGGWDDGGGVGVADAGGGAADD